MKYTNWQRATPYETATFLNVGRSPNLVALRDYLMKRFGGKFLGIGGDPGAARPVRGGTAPSSHNFGAALDWRYETRSQALNEVLPFLIDHHELLGVQMIVDYVGSRSWNVERKNDAFGGWRTLKASKTTGMGQSWAGWLHIETNSTSWSTKTSIEERFPKAEEFPPFAPEFGLFSLWPIVKKPLLQGPAEGDIVRYLQGVLRKAGGGLAVDGQFGRITRDHVVMFQLERGLKADGIVGPATWAAIDALASRP
jgi:hypothetical protein